MTPGEGDVILCVLAHEGRDLRSLYPGASLVSSDSPKSIQGLRVAGRIYVTQAATHRPHFYYSRALLALQFAARKHGGDMTVHHLDQSTAHAG